MIGTVLCLYENMKNTSIKVSVLYESNHNYCDTWNNVVDIYANHDDALMEQIKLEQNQPETDKDTQSWFITEFTVL